MPLQDRCIKHLHRSLFTPVICYSSSSASCSILIFCFLLSFVHHTTHLTYLKYRIPLLAIRATSMPTARRVPRQASKRQHLAGNVDPTGVDSSNATTKMPPPAGAYRQSDADVLSISVDPSNATAKMPPPAAHRPSAKVQKDANISPMPFCSVSFPTLGGAHLSDGKLTPPFVGSNFDPSTSTLSSDIKKTSWGELYNGSSSFLAPSSGMSLAHSRCHASQRQQRNESTSKSSCSSNDSSIDGCHPNHQKRDSSTSKSSCSSNDSSVDGLSLLADLMTPPPPTMSSHSAAARARTSSGASDGNKQKPSLPIPAATNPTEEVHGDPYAAMNEHNRAVGSCNDIVPAKGNSGNSGNSNNMPRDSVGGRKSQKRSVDAAAAKDKWTEGESSDNKNKKAKKLARWTDQEDRLLRRAVQAESKPTDWQLVSTKYFSGKRSQVQVRNRWTKNLAPTLNKGKFTEDEDNIIRQSVAMGMKWAQIAKTLPGRLTEQVKDRWTNALQPGLKRGAWTEDEIRILSEKQKVLGNQWTEIAKYIPGRNAHSVKNRWYNQQSQKKAEECGAGWSSNQ